MGQCSHRRSCTGLGKGMCLTHRNDLLVGDTFFMKPSTMVISNKPVPLFFSQRGIQDVHVESDQGGHTLHLVSGTCKVFKRKGRLHRLKREFSSCGRLLQSLPFWPCLDR